ncbi:hypothetical protein L916_19364 [Phytophthora nicotianae]|uniref:Uncharacterized protein n=1 Tax=Phytophthora nicotianae TaxID=4792 RepID=W2I0Y8_PHYNI|nr:hypothetical protein L916_19364 [Phytophthora nicotianae]
MKGALQWRWMQQRPMGTCLYFSIFKLTGQRGVLPVSWMVLLKKGDLNMLKWLHENRADWCTNWILKNAVYSGHLGTICWLLVHYPGLKLESVEMAEDAPNKFDVVLLLVWHFGQSWITSDFVEESILPGDAKPHDNYIAEWVREKM